MAEAVFYQEMPERVREDFFQNGYVVIPNVVDAQSCCEIRGRNNAAIGCTAMSSTSTCAHSSDNAHLVPGYAPRRSWRFWTPLPSTQESPPVLSPI